ncbi:MFS general substrate transporter [Cutaneotrichosporon oleaginosum]|uniref:MFS general substrate transporter n=1 Tax=Cutaneotrichosporon oleaginosum TaxID=879819 RepID=A0A0J1B1A4_9TREE|nr:MFS general substrate transporter [Cutaneotrichosporon oleaginosum]KLT41379.1 MFS general substrate transporter [Cutaneotrichosporon oleaginosum]TXT06321.1 hypothetical protein COLE_05652 [Cutaneotrichosporon oleaginosum]
MADRSAEKIGIVEEADVLARCNKTEIDEYDVAAAFLANVAARPDGAALLAPWTEEEERRVRRKIDFVVLTTLFFCTLMSGTDKVVLGTAATFGLQSDLGLKGQQYSWANSMLSLGMIAMMLPQCYFAQRFNLIGKLYAANVVGYGIVMFGMSGVKDYRGLWACRFFLGVLEGGAPSLGGLLISMWWRRGEQNLRAAVVYSTLSSVVNGLLSFAMQFYNPGPIGRWRLLFVVMACWSVLTGIVALVFLPNNPTSAWWMTDREKVIAVRRVAGNNTGVTSQRIKRAQIVEGLADPKTWVLFVCTCCLNIPNGGLVGFNSLIVKSLGFSIKETTLLAIPTGVISWLAALAIAFAAQRTRRPVACIIAGVLVCLAAVIMLHSVPRSNKSASLGALFLLFCYWGPNVAIGSYLIYANVAGASKKVTVFGIIQIAYCVGNLIGPQSFLAREEPTYRSAIITMLCGYCVAIVLLVTYAFLCARDNRRKDTLPQPEAAEADGAEDASSVAAEWRDLTDKQNPAFRYTW